MKKFIFWLFIVLFITCGVIYLRLTILKNGIVQKINDLQKVSPITSQELQQLYYGKVEKNYANEFEKAIVLFKKNIPNEDITFIGEVTHKNKKRLSQKEIKKMANINRSNQSIYQILDKIPINNRCRFLINSGGTFGTLDMKNLAILIFLRMLLAIQSNNIPVAIQSFHNSIAIMNAMNEAPYIASLLVLEDILSTYMLARFSELLRLKLTAKQIQSIMEGIQSLRPITPKPYLDSGVVSCMDIWNEFKKDQNLSFEEKIWGTFTKRMLRHLGGWEEAIFIQNSNLSYKDKFLRVQNSKLLSSFDLGHSTFPLIIFINTASYNEIILLFKVSLAIEKYYHTYKKYPKNLTTLVDKKYLDSIPRHIYTQAPFEYVPFNNGYELANFDIPISEHIDKVEIEVENKK